MSLLNWLKSNHFSALDSVTCLHFEDIEVILKIWSALQMSICGLCNSGAPFIFKVTLKVAEDFI